MLDLHCHLLPQIDDGPPSVDDSEALGREMYDSGVRVVAATPHCRSDHPTVVPSELAERCARLERRLERADAPLRVLPAGEVDLVWGLDAREEDLRLVSYSQRGTDLLVESPYGPLPSNFEELLFGFSMRGYRVLLAHPERNPTFRQDIERLAELVRRGTLVQITAGSLSRSRGYTRSLLERGLAHVLASDAHGPAAPGRGSLRAGAETAVELVGKARTRWMVLDAPLAIVNGEPLPEAPPLEATRRTRLRRLGTYL